MVDVSLYACGEFRNITYTFCGCATTNDKPWRDEPGSLKNSSKRVSRSGLEDAREHATWIS